MDVLKVKNIKERDLLMNHEENEMCYCEEEAQMFIYHADKGWQIVEGKMKASGSFDVNYREFLINTIKDFDEMDLEKQTRAIREWCESHISDYYILNCREINYWTCFKFVEGSEPLIPVLGECLAVIGTPIFIEVNQKSDAIIFWMRDKDNKVFEAYFFQGDGFVIDVGGY